MQTRCRGTPARLCHFRACCCDCCAAAQDKWTPLHARVAHGAVEAAEALIRAGANISAGERVRRPTWQRVSNVGDGGPSLRWMRATRASPWCNISHFYNKRRWYTPRSTVSVSFLCFLMEEADTSLCSSESLRPGYGHTQQLAWGRAPCRHEA